MKKIIFLYILIHSFVIKSQVSVSVSGATSFVECGLPDTVIVKITNATATTIRSVSINLPFQTYMNYVDTVSNTIPSNISNLNSPVLGLKRDSILPGQTDSIVFLTRTLCGYTAAWGLGVNIRANVSYTGAAGSPRIGNYNGYSSFRPNLVFSEQFLSNPQLVARVDSVVRIWKITQNNLNAHVKNVFLQNNYAGLRLDSIKYSGDNLAYTTLPSARYTNSGTKLFLDLDSSIIDDIGDNDKIFENGDDTIYVKTWFKVQNCSPSSFLQVGYANNIVTDRAQFCNPNNGFFASLSPVIQLASQIQGLLDLDTLERINSCTTRELRFSLKNVSTLETKAASSTLFDIQLYENSFYLPLRDNFWDVDSISIDGFIIDSVEFKTRTSYSGGLRYFVLGDFITSSIPGSLLKDIDGDGEFDDLLRGDSTVITYYVNKKRETRTTDPRVGATLNASYTSSCGATTLTLFNRTSPYYKTGSGVGINSITYNGPSSLNVNDTTYTRYHNIRLGAFISTLCDSNEFTTVIQLAKGIKLDSSLNAHRIGGYLGNSKQLDSISWEITYKMGQYDTPYQLIHQIGNQWSADMGALYNSGAFYSIIPTCKYFEENDLCEALTGFTITIKDAWATCYSGCGVERDSNYSTGILYQSPPILVADPNNVCSYPGNLVTTNYFDARQITKWYTDEFFTGPKATTINRWKSGDSIQFLTNGVVRGGTHDSLVIHLEVANSNVGSTIDTIFAWVVNEVRIFDASTGNYHFDTVASYTYNNTTLPSEPGSLHAYFAFDLNRMAIPGGVLSVGDSIWSKVIGVLYFENVSGFLNAAKGSILTNQGSGLEECNVIQNNFTRFRLLSVIANNAQYVDADKCEGYLLFNRATQNQHEQNQHTPFFSFDSIKINVPIDYFVVDTNRPVSYVYGPHEFIIPSSLIKYTANGVEIDNTSKFIYPINGGISFAPNQHFKVPASPGCRLRDNGQYYNQYGDGNTLLTNNHAVYYGNYFEPGHHLYKKDSIFGGRFANQRFINLQSNYSFTPIVNSVIIDSITERFIFNINNLSTDRGADSVYLYIKDPNNILTIQAVNNLSNSNTYSFYTLANNDKVVKLDTFSINEIRSLEFLFNTNSCLSETFSFNLGFSCLGSYPSDSVITNCNNGFEEAFFNITPQLATLQTNLLVEPVGFQNICDTHTFVLQLTNTNIGNIDSISFRFFMPASSSSIVATSVASLNGTSYPITPSLSGNIFSFDLKNQVLDSSVSKIFTSNDTILITLGIASQCGSVSGENYTFGTVARQVCGDLLPVQSVVSLSPVNFIGVTPVYSADIGLLGNGVLNSCGPSNYTVRWQNLGGSPGFDTTIVNDSIWVTLPAGVSYSGNFTGTVNTPTNTVPTGGISPQGTTYAWGLPVGITPGDSVIFSFDISGNVNDTCGETYTILSESARIFNLNCNGSNCNTPVTTANDTTVLTNDKATLSLITTGGTQNGCNDSITVNIGLFNTGLPVATGTNTTIYFLADSNNNGVYDSTDVLLTSYSTTDSILTNDTLNITYTFYPTTYNGEGCNIIAFLDTSSCVCSGDTSVLIPITLSYPLNDTLVCEGDSVNLNVCAGTGYYPSRTFDWEGATTYLSDSTLLSPVFRAPNNITNDTTFVFVLHTDRDSCTATDTINILVLASPSGTLADTMICLGDSATLTSITGIYFEVWDAATGGSLLGTTDYKVSPLVTTTYYLTAIDSMGGCPSLTRDSVTVYIDTVAPIITCQPATIYLGTNGQIIIDTTGLIASVSDNCSLDSVWVNSNDTLLTCANIGTNQVTIYVMDNNGNIDSCVSTITVLDTINPTVVCKDTTIYLSPAGTYTIDTSYVLASLSDNCGIDSVWLTPTNFTCADTGFNTVTIYARDNNNNIDSCIANVRVLDTIPPMISCNDTIIYLSPTGTYTIDTSYIYSSSFAGCGLDSIWTNNTLFTCVNLGANTVTLYARDVNGNIDSCTANVTVLDTISPTVTCKDTTIYLNALGQYIIDTSYIHVSNNDNCGVDSIWTNDTLYDCSNIGTTQATIYVRDASGNISICIANITVVDTLAPQIVCNDTTIYLSLAGTYTIDTSYVLASLSDNCGIDSVWLTPTNFTCADTGFNTVTIYVRDANNNMDSCTATVTVLDTVNPIVSCQNATIYLDALGEFIIDTSYVYSSSFAGCGLDSIWIADSVFDCSRIGVNTVSVYARDINGNVDSCQATVTVLDTLRPIISCGTTLYDTVSNSCEYIVPDFRGIALPTDNCTDSINFQITQTPLAGTVITVLDQFTQNIVITVTDTNGNQTVCSFDVNLTCEDKFQIPEFISPNGDGKNDTWIITGIENYPNNGVKIFNRYGTIVYETKSYANTWGGRANTGFIFQAGTTDHILPSGTYFYRLELDVNDNNSEVFTGIIQIQK